MPIRDGDLAAEMALQKQSPLFRKLPPEIRNDIFEYAFTTGDSSSRKNLAKIEKPCIDLLLTCQRVFAESSSHYESARTAFWTENTFYINWGRNAIANGLSPKGIVDSLHDREIDLIQKIVITFEQIYPLVANDKEWHLIARSDSMRGWVLSRSTQHDSETLTTVGKKRGLVQLLVLVS